MLRIVLIVLLVLFLIGAFPGTPWGHHLGGLGNYGYFPSGGALILIILVLLLL